MTIDFELRAALERLGAPKVRRYILGWCQPSGQAWDPAEHHEGRGHTAPLSNVDGTGPRRWNTSNDVLDLSDLGAGLAHGIDPLGGPFRDQCANGMRELSNGIGVEYEYMIQARGWR